MGNLGKAKKMKRIKSVVICLVVMGVLYIGLLQIMIGMASNEDVPQNADYLIVLGARVKGNVPSLAFKSRINAAFTYLENNKNTIVIASGGMGSGERISEAECVKRELVDKGISESRIILENRSTSTYENIKNSKGLIPKEAKTGIIVTNNFHLYRALNLAYDQGLYLHGLPAKTPKSAILKSYIREYLAITKYYLESKLLKIH